MLQYQNKGLHRLSSLTFCFLEVFNCSFSYENYPRRFLRYITNKCLAINERFASKHFENLILLS